MTHRPCSISDSLISLVMVAVLAVIRRAELDEEARPVTLAAGQ